MKMDGSTTSSSSPYDSCRLLKCIFSANNDDGDEWYRELSFEARVAAYIIILGTIIIIIFLILKFLSEYDAEFSTDRLPEPAGEGASVTTPLMSVKSPLTTYGTGKGDGETASFSSSEDVYNEKLCVICYEEWRNCFFVPCGHSATCRGCARKLMEADTRVCPICRRVIRKSRRTWFRF
ncbi:PREDICTED: E3 ubiquitin-protein ligase SPL1 [Tarenaya hassleriana]|uniref:E3 ubiquitin-protein ligase SPL1 n=1 Tax=Tarenaya hassleriana TaxID=28532 RepID=UPI00053C0868|nr:PREDICTED: E3 ubiquitin-protein ligase SPL1 [Tarenaya hassleriana]